MASYIYANDIDLITDKENDRLIFVEKAKNQFRISIYDENFKFLDSINIERTTKIGGEIVYSTILDNVLNIVLSSGSRKNFSLITIDLASKEIIKAKNVLKLWEEDFLQLFTNSNKLYALASSRVKQELNLYQLKKNGNELLKKFDMSNIEFKTQGSKNEKLKYLFRDKGMPSPYPNLKKLSDLYPYPLTGTSSLSKCYQKENIILITLDHNRASTKILTIDLDKLSLSHKEINKPLLKSKKGRSNSLIKKDLIYQLVVDNSELILSVKNYLTNETIYENSASETQITFINGPFTFEGTRYVNSDITTKEFDSREKFFTKISNKTPSISVDHIDDKYIITLGSSASFDVNRGLNFLGNSNGFDMSYSYTPESLITDDFFKSTFVRCVFDSDMNQLKNEEIPSNIFRKISDYKENNKINKDTVESIGYINGNFIYVYLDKGIYNFLTFD